MRDRQRMREAAGKRFKIMWDRLSGKLAEWRDYRDNFAPVRGIFGEGGATGDNF